jgi:hypothetical protein
MPTKNVGTAARSDYEVIAGVNYKPAVRGSGDLSGVKFVTVHGFEIDRA